MIMSLFAIKKMQKSYLDTKKDIHGIVIGKSKVSIKPFGFQNFMIIKIGLIDLKIIQQQFICKKRIYLP